MAWDDTPYWAGNNKTIEINKPSIKLETPNLAQVKRSLPWANKVMSESDRLKRAPKPSLLLEEYLREKGLPIT